MVTSYFVVNNNIIPPNRQLMY